MEPEAFDDLARLRRTVVRLITEGRVRLTIHALTTHTGIPVKAKVKAILRGRGDQPNRKAAAGRRSYVCWYDDPHDGLLRGLYAVAQTPADGQVVILSVFPE